MKTRIGILLIVIGFLFGFQKNGSTGPKIEKGTIKVTIFYPNEKGSTFDMDYYTNTHVPMAANFKGHRYR